MSFPRLSAALCCALVAQHHQAAGFAPSPNHAMYKQSSTNLDAHSSYASRDDGAMLVMHQASLCANSDTCSIEEAEEYLLDIVRVQSECAAGTLSDSCNDVGYATEVVADLRSKISAGAKSSASTFWEKRQEEYEDLVTASLSSDGTGFSSIASLTQAPIKPAYLAFAALYTMVLVSFLNPDAIQTGVVPFTPQEVWWSVRDGYAGDFLSHMLRNGGLSIGENVAALQPQSVPFQPQEVWWAIRDGYAGDLFSHASRNGGLLIGDDTTALQSQSVPFAPEEVWWAIRGGYLGDLVSHASRNGGLLIGDEAEQFRTMAFKPEEIYWSVRDGYFGDLVSHAMRNGGLRI